MSLSFGLTNVYERVVWLSKFLLQSLPLANWWLYKSDSQHRYFVEKGLVIVNTYWQLKIWGSVEQQLAMEIHQTLLLPPQIKMEKAVWEQDYVEGMGLLYWTDAICIMGQAWGTLSRNS